MSIRALVDDWQGWRGSPMDLDNKAGLWQNIGVFPVVTLIPEICAKVSKASRTLFYR